MSRPVKTTRIYLGTCLNPACEGVAVFSSVWNYPEPLMHTTVICTKCDSIMLDHWRLDTDIDHVPNQTTKAAEDNEKAKLLAYATPDASPDPGVGP